MVVFSCHRPDSVGPMKTVKFGYSLGYSSFALLIKYLVQKLIVLIINVPPSFLVSLLTMMAVRPLTDTSVAELCTRSRVQILDRVCATSYCLLQGCSSHVVEGITLAPALYNYCFSISCTLSSPWH